MDEAICGVLVWRKSSNAIKPKALKGENVVP